MKIGIDLGTSYSSVAANIDGKIEMIRVATGASAFGDSFSMPSAVYIDDEGILLGQAALSKRRISPSNFKNEFKRDFGTTAPYVIAGEEYLPEQLYTEIFMYFKNQALVQTGQKPESVCITYPANYGNNKKRLLEKAAGNAGLFNVKLVDEPTAAAAGYSRKNKIENGDILLVYDLGGGTFDTAIIKKVSDSSYIHLAEPVGISQCGGIDFDHAIFDDIMRKMSESGNFDIERLLKEKRFTATLNEVCVQIKHQLSHAQSHTEPIAVGFDYFDYTITRDEFENMIRPLVSNTCEKVKDIIRSAGLVASDIDRVLLVGGSSRIPLVQEMVCSTLQKKDIYFDADPELSVCQGAVSLISEVEKNREPEYVQPIQDKEEAAEKVNIPEAVSSPIQPAAKDILINMNLVDSNHDLMRRLAVDLMLGLCASDGQWIYYLENNKFLHKVRRNGTQITRLSYCDAEYPVKVDGEWIYYRVIENKEGNKCNFYKIKKDGTTETKVTSECTFKIENKFAVENGWLYFINSMGNLKKASTDGAFTSQLGNDTNIRQAVLDGEWIYYISYSPNYTSKSLCRISKDGRERTVINQYASMQKIDVSNGCIIYESSNYKEQGLWKINADGTGKSCVCDDRVNAFNTIGDWLYYEVCNYASNAIEKKIYKCRFDGTERQIVG